MTLLFESPYLRIEHEESANYLVARWAGFTSLKEFEAGSDELMCCLYEKKASGWLQDNSLHRGVEPTGQRYLAERVKGYIEKCGPLYLAVLESKDVFGRLSLNSFSQQMGKNDPLFQQEIFVEESDAHLWLETNAKRDT